MLLAHNYLLSTHLESQKAMQRQPVLGKLNAEIGNSQLIDAGDACLHYFMHLVAWISLTRLFRCNTSIDHLTETAKKNLQLISPISNAINL